MWVVIKKLNNVWIIDMEDLNLIYWVDIDNYYDMVLLIFGYIY